ncbi:UDP binding domain-containing protein, partial [Nostoc sp. NIES-2111]
ARPVATVLGLTFKENVPDTRNSRVVDIVAALRSAGVEVQVHDPLADAEAAAAQGIKLTPADALQPADVVILCVAHREYREGGWPLVRRLARDGSGLVYDVRGVLPRDQKPAGMELRRL